MMLLPATDKRSLASEISYFSPKHQYNCKGEISIKENSR